MSPTDTLAIQCIPHHSFKISPTDIPVYKFTTVATKFVVQTMCSTFPIPSKRSLILTASDQRLFWAPCAQKVEPVFSNNAFLCYQTILRLLRPSAMTLSRGQVKYPVGRLFVLEAGSTIVCSIANSLSETHRLLCLSHLKNGLFNGYGTAFVSRNLLVHLR